METSGVKEEARQLVEQLADDSTWDDLMHRIYIRQAIERGLADSDAEQITNVENVRLKLGITADRMNWSSCPAVERDPEKVSGAWVFTRTRVPVVALFENLESGASIDDFLDWFPGVEREQVEQVLECAIRSLGAGRQTA